MADYELPEVDVPAMTPLLDGTYVEVRNLTRKRLVEYASILDDQREMDRSEFRERVKEVVVELAGTGQTGLGFPTEYGGGGGIGAAVPSARLSPRSRRWPSATCRCWSRSVSSSACSAGRSCSSAPSGTTTPTSRTWSAASCSA